MAGGTAGGSIDRLTVWARLAVLCFGVRQAQRESNITFREIWLPNFFCQLPIKRGRKNIQRERDSGVHFHAKESVSRDIPGLIKLWITYTRTGLVTAK